MFSQKLGYSPPYLFIYFNFQLVILVLRPLDIPFHLQMAAPPHKVDAMKKRQ